MARRMTVTSSAIWHTHMAHPHRCAMARTYERYPRTNATNARLQDIEKSVQLVTVRVGLWITRFSSAVAS